MEQSKRNPKGRSYRKLDANLCKQHSLINFVTQEWTIVTAESQKRTKRPSNGFFKMESTGNDVLKEMVQISDSGSSQVRKSIGSLEKLDLESRL